MIRPGAAYRAPSFIIRNEDAGETTDGTTT